ncbi:MAG: NAD(P)-binding domain-containing protein [Erysipelotrichaceae bacterium]|nr:NAD(P)-binding domain-containing protein [Erysipelotrichaceae bacterium]
MKVTILGCGVYGLALATSFLEKNNQIFMWSKFDEEVQNLKEKYFHITFSTDLDIATRDSDLIVIAIPVAFLDETMQSYQKFYHGEDILIASKGIETKEQRFAYEIVQKYLKNAPIGVISGGTFAQDMHDKKVMGLTLATKINSIEKKVKIGLESSFLKVQYSHDLIGVSVCGAIKNVMAIGFGMLDGASYPPSSRFLFLTKAIYEIRDFISLLGGNPDTIMTYAGIDDIMMTCTSSQSRNYTLGKLIGEKANSQKIEEYKQNTTIEGLGTSKAIFSLAKKNNIVLPFSSIIYKILYESVDVRDLIHLLEESNT